MTNNASNPGGPNCVYLVPSYGWPAPGGLDNNPVKLGVQCDWANAHPEVIATLPEWMATEMLCAPGWRPHHCKTCKHHSPAKGRKP